jgi:methylmalonyl-CoA mutase cobalamin-binding domain/chain
MYLVVAEKQGADWKKISGTLQNDILKEYIAQKEWIYPIQPAMKLVVDTFEFCTQHVPRYNPISVSGYHIREAGATAVQELAFTLRDGLEYVEWGLKAGLDIDRSFREFHSSSMRTTISSRKLRSIELRGESGREKCAIGLARRTNAP